MDNLDEQTNSDSCQEIHVVPTHGQKHIESQNCWCHPVLVYKDEITDNEVWKHKGYEELEQ